MTDLTSRVGDTTGISVYCDSVKKKFLPRYVFRNTGISAISGNSSFISIDSLRKGSCHVLVGYLSWNRHYINILIKTGRAVVNNNTSISYGCLCCHALSAWETLRNLQVMVT